MDRIELTLNEQKTSIRDGRTEQFDFLGYTFGPLYSWRTGRRYIAASPSKKSLKRFRTSVHLLLRPQETGPWEQVRTRLNAMLRGWQNYFSYRTVARTYSSLNRYVYEGSAQSRYASCVEASSIPPARRAARILARLVGIMCSSPSSPTNMRGLQRRRTAHNQGLRKIAFM
jgi:hypothetical protein